MSGRRVHANRLSVALLLAACATFAHAQQDPPAVTPAQPFSHITSVTPLADGMELHDGPLVMRIVALRDDVLRIRASATGALPEDASWAVLPAARKASVHVTQQSDVRTAAFATAVLRIAFERSTGLMRLTDLAGNVIEADAAPLSFEDGGFHLQRAMPHDAHYFGLGDKTGAFDRREQAFHLWNTDAYAWQESTDPLYKSIPFYLDYRAGATLGVLIDNTFPSSFDFGKTLSNIVQYRAEGGPADIYLLYGPSAKNVLASYAWLTGPTPLPPLWALGFQQSRYSYMTQDRVLEVAARLRADHIPADAIYLDIDYQQHNRPFTVNTTTFPDFAGMIARLHAEHFHVVAITDLHIADLPNANYAPYDSGIAGDHFVHNPDGSRFVGPVWPGPSLFPDFTRAETRAWWGMLYTQFDRDGIDGFWNDMNEPSVFDADKTMPDDVVHRIAGDEAEGFAPRTAPHREIHNIYGMENSRATYEGQLAQRPDVRPFVLTRASYAGGQRYAATWTGDNSATWNHLRLTTLMLKNLGLSGFSLAGADVGGYAGTPTPELLTKWIEFGAFQPIDRDHAEKGTGNHEPWVGDPGQEAIRRRFIETRYRLLPYLYTTMEDNTRTGLPLERPIFLEFPDASPDHHPVDMDLQAEGEFMLGPDLLVAPPPFPDKLDAYAAELPGAGWYDFWTGARIDLMQVSALSDTSSADAARATFVPSLTLKPALDTLPVFVRAGAILPVAPPMQSTEDQSQGPLTLRVFPGPECHGSLYQDDGTSFAYKRGQFLRMGFTCDASHAHELRIHIGPHEGPFPAWWHDLAIEVNGLAAPPTSITINGRALPSPQSTFTIPDDGKGFDILLRN